MDKLQGLITSQKHLESELCQNVLKEHFKIEPAYTRKIWELLYIYQMLKLSGMLSNNKKGLGFGCGEERTVPVLAKLNCKLTCTDLSLTDAEDKGWAVKKPLPKKDSIFKRGYRYFLKKIGLKQIEKEKKVEVANQHCLNLESYRQFTPKICNFDVLEKNIEVDVCDMNNIDPKFKTGEFDFIWSCCAFEHLGNIQNGLDFIVNSMECLKPGGIAIHTTEFNVDSLNDDFDGTTLEADNLVFYRKSDFDELEARLAKLGHHMYSIDYTLGTMIVDKFIDFPPYTNTNLFPTHLKLKLGGHVASCIGIVIKKKE